MTLLPSHRFRRCRSIILTALLAAAGLMGVRLGLTSLFVHNGAPVAASAAAMNARDHSDAPTLPRPRPFPIAIVPHGEFADAVSDQQLKTVLSSALPYWRPLRVSTTLHALRLWGLDAAFPPGIDPPPGPSGRQFLELLTDNARWHAENPSARGDFLMRTPYGIRVSVASEPISGSLLGAGHVDQLLSTLADARIPLATPIRPASGSPGTVADVLADSLRRFSIYQEMEFTAAALSRWLPPAKSWTNRFGEVCSFDDIARALCERPLGVGACDGTHVFYSMAILLDVDREYDILNDSSAAALGNALKNCVLALEAHELPTGGWDSTWSGERPPRQPGQQSWSTRFERISNTGHHLEWIALAPSSARPGLPLVQRAVAALVAEIESLTLEERANSKHFWPLSHAARALVLLRNEDAFHAWQSLAPPPSAAAAPDTPSAPLAAP